MGATKPTYILGLNTTYHELSAALLKDGVLIAATEEERFSRIKHGKTALTTNPDQLPMAAIKFCLQEAKISAQDIDHVAFGFNPPERLRNIGADTYYEDGSWGSESGENTFVSKLLEIPTKLTSEFGSNFENKVHWVPHQIAHAGSAFYVSGYESSALLSIDGIGEFSSTWLGEGSGKELKTFREINYPNSIGFLWEKFCKFLGFSEYDACKVMGLASFGNENRFYTTFRKFVTPAPPSEGGFVIDNNVVKFRIEDYTALETIFGIKKINSPSELTSDHEDIAAGLQKITNEIMIGLVKYLADETKSTNLCLAGGVALNCVSNYEILRSGHFKSIYIQPAAHDAGTALGAAYYVWHGILGNPRTSFVMDHGYTGPQFSDEEIEALLIQNGLNYSKPPVLEVKVAQLLSEGSIIGWFQGKMEWGPRALGNRTMMVDPRNPNMKEILNDRVKKREPFRPFAPSVLVEDAEDWFEIPANCESLGKEFMLYAFPVKTGKVGLIPAVTHVDNTSRIQIVREEINPKYYKLIQEFKKVSGVPMVLNTSFNDNEPIVCSAKDAINTFMKTKMDWLAIGPFLVSEFNN